MLFTEKDKKAIHDAIGAVSDSVKELAAQMPDFHKVVEVERTALAKAVTEAEKRLAEGSKAHQALVDAKHELLAVGHRVTETTEVARKKLAEDTVALVAKAEAGMQDRADEIAAELDKKTNRIGGMTHDIVDEAKKEVVGFVEARVSTTVKHAEEALEEMRDTVRAVQNKADSIKSFDRKLDILDDKLKALAARIEVLEKSKAPAAPVVARK